ncbi:MAG TPA: Rad52/Rad22 family DNA repair protein [Ktedonobacterales bacterium]|nr:Rad52/Rad22 family DNA repair protein [Ktedonobacterales bacterium]
MSDETTVWLDLREKLARPFDPADVDFRPQMSGKSDAGSRVQAVCYIDARVVADRLDEVVGPGEWSFRFEPLVIERGEIQIAKGALTIHGVTKEDVGDGSTFATSKGCVSDALKRAAVLWGVGRYLYAQPVEWVTLDAHKRISDADLAKLRARLPRPDGAQPTPPSRPAPTVAPIPAEMEQAAREAAAATRQDERPPIPAQRNALETLSAKLGYAIPGGLTYETAGALIASWSEDLKQRAVQQQKAGTGATR